jgi:Macrocin-O-methyltransferase (TylF)
MAVARQSKTSIKHFLMTLSRHIPVTVPRHIPGETVTALGRSVKYLQLGNWMRTRGFEAGHRFEQRNRLFDLAAKDLSDREVLYLEFGVYQGEATRYWSQLLRNPKSSLHGFDSFEGLPEDWREDCGKGHFSTNGNMPLIDDQRVKFFKGWFDQTLPSYQFPGHEAVFINLDADLYSSTIYVLRTLRDIIKPGTYIYFDEFSDMNHEFRAFDEFLSETGMKFSLVGEADAMQHVLFRREA